MTVFEPIASSHELPAIESMVISVSICHRRDGLNLSTVIMILEQRFDFWSVFATTK